MGIFREIREEINTTCPLPVVSDGHSYLLSFLSNAFLISILLCLQAQSFGNIPSSSSPEINFISPVPFIENHRLTLRPQSFTNQTLYIPCHQCRNLILKKNLHLTKMFSLMERKLKGLEETSVD